MKEVVCTGGVIALVDDQDFDLVNGFKWRISQNGYPFTRLSKDKIVTMHRLLMGEPKDIEVDHIDRNILNNQRSNLRLASKSQQSMNKSKSKGKSSKFKGVCFHKQTGRWEAYIKLNYKKIHLGLFSTEMDAAYAYDESAKTMFGEFAALNFSVGA